MTYGNRRDWVNELLPVVAGFVGEDVAGVVHYVSSKTMTARAACHTSTFVRTREGAETLTCLRCSVARVFTMSRP